MCLANPAQILELNGDEALVDYGGLRKTVNIQLLAQKEVGDWVLVHAGFAIQKISEEEAQETLAIYAEMAKQVQSSLPKNSGPEA